MLGLLGPVEHARDVPHMNRASLMYPHHQLLPHPRRSRLKKSVGDHSDFADSLRRKSPPCTEASAPCKALCNLRAAETLSPVHPLRVELDAQSPFSAPDQPRVREMSSIPVEPGQHFLTDAAQGVSRCNVRRMQSQRDDGYVIDFNGLDHPSP
jgi:hypothetical protein